MRQYTMIALFVVGCGYDPHPTYSDLPDAGGPVVAPDASPADLQATTAPPDALPAAPDAGTPGSPDVAEAGRPDVLAVPDAMPTQDTRPAAPDLATTTPDTRLVPDALATSPDMTPAKTVISISSNSTLALGSTTPGVPGLEYLYSVTNEQGPPTGALTVTVNNPEIVISGKTCGASLALWESCSVGLRLSPSTGSLTGTVTAILTVTGTNGSANLTVTGTVVGPAVPDAGADAPAGPDAQPTPDVVTPPTSLSVIVLVSPGVSSDHVYFGNVLMGNSSSSSIMITNAGHTTSGVITASLSGVGYSQVALILAGCDQKFLAPGEVCTLRVVYSPTDLTGVNGAVLIGDGTTSTSVSMTGTAVMGSPDAGASDAISRVCIEQTIVSPMPPCPEGYSFYTQHPHSTYGAILWCCPGPPAQACGDFCQPLAKDAHCSNDPWTLEGLDWSAPCPTSPSQDCCCACSNPQ